MTNAFDQHDYAVRFAWGPNGVQALAPTSDVVVIVDVLSFTTAVSVAAARGALVYPYRWRDASAAPFADDVGAVLAGERTAAGYSLSPSSLDRVAAGERLVLPSPNGSTCADLAAGSGATVLAASLRNASAVARWLDARPGVVSVVAAGERWSGGGLRPAVEDLVGAGAVIARLARGPRSREAEAALGAYRAGERDLRDVLLSCSSGRELVGRGFESDVLMAAELDADDVVPVLSDGAFRGAGPA